MKKIAGNRRTNNGFNELTKDINMPNIPVTKLNIQTINRIDTFLKSENGIPLNNERLVFDNHIVGTYQRIFKKENAREIFFDTHNYRPEQLKELLERLLLGLMARANYTDSWYIEYNIKGENAPRYQVLSPLNEGKLEEYIDTYLNNESDVISDSYFFFDAVPADIESIKVIDNTKYPRLKAYDENNDEININIDKRGVIRNSNQHIRTGAWFPYYHVVSDLDLNSYQIFSKDQLDIYKEDNIFTDHCFINSMKFYKLDNDVIEFAKDLIKDVLPLKYLDKICKELNIPCDVSFVDNPGNQHTSKRYGIGNTNMKIILMYEHFIPNVIVDKLYIPSNLKINRNIKLSSLIYVMIILH
jgi:hypothetical protein